MKTKAAILWESARPWSVEEIELDPPGPGEVLVKMAASGHVPLRRAPRHRRPAVRAADHRRPRGCRRRAGGRRGRQLAEPGRPRRVRLHPVLRSLPVPCSTGHQNLCDLGALHRRRPADRRRHVAPPRARARTCGLMCLLGTFAHHTVVNEASCIKIDERRPARPGLPARLRRRDRLGLGGLRGRGRARATPSPSSASAASAPTRSRAPGSPGPSTSSPSTPSSSSGRRRMEFGATHTAASLEEAMELIARRSPGARWPTRSS